MKSTLYVLFAFLFIISPIGALDLSKVRGILAEKQTDPYTRYWKADTLISKQRNSDSLVIIAYEKILLPFADRKLRDKNERAIAMSWAYGKLDYYYAKRGLYDMAIAYARKGVDYIVQSDSNRYIAEAFDYLATKEDRYGDRGRSIEAIFSAIDYFKRVRGSEQRINVCYYQLSILYSASEDGKALWDLVQKMEAVAQSAQDSFAYYQYYSVKASYYSLNQNRRNHAFVDSSILYSKRAIEIYTRYPGKILYRTPISYAYLNVALLYDLYQNRDSVVKYLELAEHNRDVRDNKIFVPMGILWARQDYYHKLYAGAQRRIFEVLELIEKSKSSDMLVDKCDALELLVKIYEDTGRLQEAMAYQKLYIEAYKERFDFEADNTLQNLTVKYETQQKEQEIALLTERNKNFKRGLYGMIALVLLLVLAFILLLYLLHLRRKSRIQQQYEAVMEAEIKMLEQPVSSSDAADSPSQAIVGRMTLLMEQSSIEGGRKQGYLDKLRQTDLNLLDRQYSLAKERLSMMDMKYIACFWIEMEATDIALLFNIEYRSVYVVRCRIKKKFDKHDLWHIV